MTSDVARDQLSLDARRDVERWQARNLALILAGVLAVRLVALYFNRTDLFFDEAQYWSWSLVPDFGYYSKPPLIAWIIGGMTAICGHGESCIRAASPLMHTVTAWLVYLTGWRLYDARTGFWSGVAFATLPGVSFSAGLISTDVPLLLCWAGALYAFVRLAQTSGRQWGPAIGLGVSIGLGLNAKYAMAYFIVCLVMFLVTTPARRPLLRDPRLYCALAIAAALLAPNVFWNAQHAFATFGHTADNANWGRSLFHPSKMAEFFLAQFGVFGPVFFAMLLAITWQSRATVRSEADRLTLYLSLPVLVAITIQALMSRAHANWAAVTYVSATPLVVSALLRAPQGWRWLTGSIAVHVSFAALLSIVLATAGLWTVPLKNDPLARVMGWHELAQALKPEIEKAQLHQKPYRAIVTDDRMLTATLLYYMRDGQTPILAWRPPNTPPHDHYELTRAYQSSSGGPALLISLNPGAGGIPARFGTATELPPVVVSAGKGSRRTIFLYSVSSYKTP